MVTVTDLNIEKTKIHELVPPSEVKKKFPASEAVLRQVAYYRQMVQNILLGKDRRLLFLFGPCSADSLESMLLFLESDAIKSLPEVVKNELLLVVRVYGIKTRTTTGWQGLYMDPFMALDDIGDIVQGAYRLREIMLKVAELGWPIVTEVADPFMPQYVDDLVSYYAIGARTAETPLLRGVASGLSAPVLIKNSTTGSVQTAIDGVKTANTPQPVYRMESDGRVSLVPTLGNTFAHVALRGSKNGPNYDEQTVGKTVQTLLQRELLSSIIIDCSHDNSLNDQGKKDFHLQGEVLRAVLRQRLQGNEKIVGVMMENHYLEGNQEIPKEGGMSKGVRGKSFTDACMGREDTRTNILYAAKCEKVIQSTFR